MQEKFDEDAPILEKKSMPNYYSFVPFFKVKGNINPSYYLTSQNSINIFNSIDGKKNIDTIAENSDLNQEQVYAICKNLVKMGFIGFNN